MMTEIYKIEKIESVIRKLNGLYWTLEIVFSEEPGKGLNGMDADNISDIGMNLELIVRDAIENLKIVIKEEERK